MAKIRILGSGTSTGVPSIGCNCKVCLSQDNKDKRLRTSVLYEENGVRILLDCGPDFRQQMLQIPFKPIDGVLITHEHFDHVGGIDDLRAFSHRSELPLYANKLTVAHLKQRMPYCFIDKTYPGIPKLSLREVCAGDSFYIKDVLVTPFTVIHGRLPILGYRIGRMAYITDMLTMPELSYSFLKGVDLVVLNALRHQPHTTHQTLNQALDVGFRIGAKSTYLIHMSDGIGLHQEVSAQLPKGFFLSYDGLEVEF